MKKFQSLGRSLSKMEQQFIFGGVVQPNGCTATLTGCNGGSTTTCDYRVACPGGEYDVCEASCMSPADQSHCDNVLP